MPGRLIVNEIYLSLQGESTFAGLPCVFIRLTGCDLRCSYCDTAYAFSEGAPSNLDQIENRVKELAAPYGTTTDGMRLPIVELTGGEPLLQPASLELMESLCQARFTVLIETSGAHDISRIDSRVRRIMDIKCPSSAESERNRWENLEHLTALDEVKFVIGTREDYDWAKETLATRRLPCPILFSWVAPLESGQRHKSLKPVPTEHTPISRRELAENIIADALPVRFQIQSHKIIWNATARGV